MVHSVTDQLIEAIDDLELGDDSSDTPNILYTGRNNLYMNNPSSGNTLHKPS